MAATCPIPPDEEERLKTLHDLDLLDVSYEPSFDRITSLCCQIFDVPIALVSLVDAERQFFKSQRGLGEVRETPRDLAFCAHAIMPDAPDVMVVNDAQADPCVELKPSTRLIKKFRCEHFGCASSTR